MQYPFKKIDYFFIYSFLLLPFSMSEKTYNFKIVLIGDGGVGKTCFVKRFLNGAFEKAYIATQGATVHKMTFYTNVGTIVFNVWDTAGQEKFSGLGSGYYNGADGAIVMFDTTSRVTYQNVPDWYMNFTRVCGKYKPMVVCGNKVDMGGRKVRSRQVTFPSKKGIPYFDTSVKSNYNLPEIMLSLIRRLTGNSNVEFVEKPSMTPPEVKLTDDDIQRMKDEMEAMQNAIIDSSSDDDDL